MGELVVVEREREREERVRERERGSARIIAETESLRARGGKNGP